MELNKDAIKETMKDAKEAIVDKLKTNETPHEGEITKTVEQQTAQLPSMSWLLAAFGSMAVSAGIAAFSEKKATANFVGLWVPTLLLFGIYNKIVKLEDSDRFDHKGMFH